MPGFVLSLRDDVTLTDTGPTEIQLEVPGRPVVMVSFRQVTPPLRAVFTRLQAEGAEQDELTAEVLMAEGPQGLFKLTHFLEKMHEARLICRSATVAGHIVARLVPISTRFVFNETAAEGRVRLSRFALIRRDGERLVVESPLGFARVEILDAGLMSALHAMSVPIDAREIAAALAWTVEDAQGVLMVLGNAGALAPASVDEDAQAHHPALMQWDFHDLYFHSRSRMGRHATPFGGVFRFSGVVPPLPEFKLAMGATIALATPDLEQLKREDVPFTRVLEERRSVREHGDAPLSIEQLGAFLYRTVRVTEDTLAPGEMTRRVYPAGGALYETEIYVVVDRMIGLDSGLYHYDPRNHRLEVVTGRTAPVSALLDAAFFTADQRSRPQALLVVSARFQRMQWKYQSMTYAAILKHVGAIYQTMYLVATAMGLAPCALGGGHSDLFAEATGLDYFVEGSVGEFILGTRR